MNSVKRVRSYIVFGMIITFLYRKSPYFLLWRTSSSNKKVIIFTKISAYNFTLKTSLPEASTSSVNIIKCLQTLTNIEKSTNQQNWKIKGHIYNETKNHWKLWNYTKNCKFRSISEMGASYVNYLQKNI